MPTLLAAVEVAAYRIAQEALTDGVQAIMPQKPDWGMTNKVEPCRSR